MADVIRARLSERERWLFDQRAQGRSWPEIAELGSTYFNLGQFESRIAGGEKEAEKAYQQAREMLTRLAVEQPLIPRYRHSRAKAQGALGLLYQNMGRPEQAAAAFREALPVQEDLARTYPTVIEYTFNLGITYGSLAGLTKDGEKPEEALGLYGKAISTLEAVLKQEKDHRLAQVFLPELLKGRALFFDELGRHSEALKDWDRAVQLSGRMAPSVIRLGRASSLAQFGDHQQAAAEADDVLAKVPSDGHFLYEAACVFALCSGAALNDTTSSQAERHPLAERYGARAVVLLTKARTAGHFKDPAALTQMNADNAMNPLTKRSDFKKLLAEWEAEAKIGNK